MPEPTSPPAGPAPDQLAGRLLVGRYRLNRPIASGGMAEVWEATDETLARRVAVKVLHPHLARDASFVTRFRGEAVAAARLAHPSIVSVYDTFSVDGLEAIVMELVSGTTMRADLDQHGPMRLEAVLAIGTQVADALGAAHASGLVHRDVKPANILLSGDGRVLVADFGIAKAAEGNDLTTAGAMVGTAKYLAPEQVEGGPIDGRADLYSLGVVLYEALTGQAPFTAETDAATALARLHRDPVPPRQLRPDLSPAVEAVVLQAMARRPEARFADAAALRAALLGAGADPRRAPAAAAQAAATTDGPMAEAAPPTPSPPPPGAPAPPAEPARSRRWLAIVGLIGLMAVAAAFAVRNGSDPGGDADAVTPTGVASFDPQGDNGTEREDLVGLAIDGDVTTAWQSERYSDPDAMAGKDGVGLTLGLPPGTRLDHLDVTTPTGGWSARIYVASGDRPADLAGWGEPVASVDAAGDGATRFALPGTTGDHLLVWFTRVPADGVVQVSEVTVQGR